MHCVCACLIVYHRRSWGIFIIGIFCKVLIPGIGLSSSMAMTAKMLKLGRFLRLVKLAKVNTIARKLDDLYLSMMVSYRYGHRVGRCC